MWFFTIHGLSPGGNDDAQLLNNIASANLAGLFWAALGDFNRDPSALTVPLNGVIYHPGTSTQQSGGELDYMVSNDLVSCQTGDVRETSRVLGGLSSDHYPVDFPVVPCNGSGLTTSAPCDIYAVALTQCVAAHSTTRALFGGYTGRLYQVQRASDGVSLDINALPTGYANAAAQD